MEHGVPREPVSELKGTVFKECAFARDGLADERFCRGLTVVPMRNSMCKERKCKSRWRACWACVAQAGRVAPDDVVDPKVGLCAWHREEGATEPRPSVTQLAVTFTKASMPTSVIPGSHATARSSLDVVLKDRSPLGEDPSTPIVSPKAPKARTAIVAIETKKAALKTASVLLGGRPSSLFKLIGKAVDVLKKQGIEVKGGSFYTHMSNTLTDLERRQLGLY